MRTYLGLVQHSTATVLPQIIQPDPHEIYVTLTADCNLRCQGCRYGREFMHGHQLPWATVRDLLDDCKKLGIRNIRLYGGDHFYIATSFASSNIPRLSACTLG